MHEQGEKLMHIDDTIHRMDGTLKRVKKHLRYFARNYLTDKLIMGLIILVILAIVGVLIYSAVDTDGTTTESDNVDVDKRFRL